MAVFDKPKIIQNVSKIDKPKDFIGTLGRIFNYIKGQHIFIIISLILCIISVTSLVLLPEVLGDTTDIVVSSIMQKNAYEIVTKNYKDIEELLNGINKIKDVVNPNIQDEETYKAIYNLGYHNRDVGYLINEAKKEDSKFNKETKELLLTIPREFYPVQIRRVVGYYFDGEWQYKPIYEVDMTFREYLDLLEVNFDFSSYNQEFVNYMLDMKVNCEEYPIIKAYQQSSTIGEFVELAGIDNIIDISRAYKKVIYETSLDSKPKLDWDLFIFYITKLITLVLIYSIIGYLQGFILAKVSQKTAYQFREDLNKKINKLSISSLENIQNGEIMSILVNDVDMIATSLNQSLSQVITSIITVIGMLIMMFRMNIILSLCALIIIPISIIMMNIVVQFSQVYFKRQQEKLGNINSKVEESFMGHEVIKLYSKEEDVLKDFTSLNEDLFKSSKSSQFISGLMQPLSKLIGNFGYVMVCVIGGIYVINGALTIGALQAFVQYMKQYSSPINQFASVFNNIQATLASAERVFAFLDKEEEIEIEDKNLVIVEGKVEFKKVNFGYAKKQILKEINFSANKSQKIAIVGPTGAGKTTIAKLIMRYYDIDDGSIFIDDKNIKKFTKKSLRNQVGIILQDTWLYGDSVLENIRFGNLKAKDEEIVDICKKLGIHNFIEELDGGYNFIINSDATNLSQGQKQLINIARAMLANRKILILDEATSSIDTRLEAYIQKALEKLMQGKTIFIIAHRLFTVKDADNILVIKDGKIIEEGTHNDLVLKNGFYAELYNAQFGVLN